jgi:cytochrome c-type biogenesis protein CcmH
MKLKKLLIVVTLGLLLMPAVPVTATATMSDIGKELICQCDCSMVLTNCTHAKCSSRDSINSTISEKLDQGESKEQIIGYFVNVYGERVLASPPKKGFNLLLWVLPFAAIVAGGVVISLTLKTWARRINHDQVEADVGNPEDNEEVYHQRLKKELDEYTGDEF